MSAQGVGSPAILQSAAFPRDSPLEDFVETVRLRVSNAELAAVVESPDLVHRIVARRRLDGLEQDLRRPTTPAGVSLHVYLALFADARFADEEIADPVAPAGFAAIGALTGAVSYSAEPRRLRDRQAHAIRFRNNSPTDEPIAGLAVRTAIGRLTVAVAGIAPESRLPEDDVWRLADALVARTSRQNLPPATAEEVAALSMQTAADHILQDAFLLLHGFHHRSFDPRALLNAAYVGAAEQVAAMAGGSCIPAPPVISASDAEEAWNQFVPSYRALQDLAGTLNARSLAYTAARSMYQGHDCHTAFLDPPLFRRFVAASRGEVLATLGMTISVRPPHLVLRVLPSSPAEAAGLRAGDELVAVDGRLTSDFGSAVLALLAANADEKCGERPLSITVWRQGAPDMADITCYPRRIQALVEQHTLLPDGLGFCELNEFPRGDAATGRVTAALKSFEATQARGWILDLRWNGGGWARTMCRIAGLFLPAGSLLTTRYLPDGTEERQTTLGEPFPCQPPMAVLIGPSTASAAEIIAESLRAHGRAVLVGSRTAGCTNGGRHFALLDGSGVQLAEFAFMVGPRRVLVERVGIEPDAAVELSRQDLAAGRDPQLAAAVRLVTERAARAST